MRSTAAAGFLKVVELHGDLQQICGDHGGIGQHKIQRAERERALRKQVGSQSDRGGCAERQEPFRAALHHATHDLAPARVVHMHCEQPEVPLHGVGQRAQGAQILCACDMLFPKAAQVGKTGAVRLERRHRHAAQAQQHGHADQDARRHQHAQAPVFEQQHHEHAKQQQAVADNADHELRKKVGQRIDIAVDALDQLAGRMEVVERLRQAQAMQRQVLAQTVGGVPAEPFALPRRADRHDLRQHHHAQKQQRQAV